MEMIALGYWNLALAGVMVLVSMLLSWWFQVGLSRDILWGAVRTFVQLSLVGYILAFIFTTDRWYLVVAALAVMVVVAIHTAQGRTKESIQGKSAIYAASICSGGLIVLLYMILAVLRLDPWYEARYVLPIAGMIIGNSMTAATLAITRFASAVHDRRHEVETALALGASAMQAVDAIRRDALRTAIIPSVNAMLVVGVVSLPGMMTGQIIAGSSPEQAVRYQVVVMYMITAAAVITSVVGVLAAVRSAFTPAHQLRVPAVHRE